MRTSDQINELAGALAKAQGAITGAVKDATNPHFKTKYADLASVWDACRKPLSDNGLAVIQTVSTLPDGVQITTMLVHSSGQRIVEDLVMVPRDASPQSVGSCITYGRRYALSAMVGVAPEEDDAEAAQGRNQPTKPQGVPAQAPAGYDGWWFDLEYAAEQGIKVLEKAWNDSRPEFKAHTVKVSADAWKALKAKAEQVAA
jgi:hypothetical protein